MLILYLFYGDRYHNSAEEERHYSLMAISRLKKRTASEFIVQWSRLIIINQDFIIINLLHCAMNSDAVLLVSREIAVRE